MVESIASNYTFGTTSSFFTPIKEGVQATSPSLFGKVRNLVELIDGSWANDVGIKWHEARKTAKTTGSPSNFSFWEAYYDSHLEKEIKCVGKEATEEAAKKYVKENVNLDEFAKLSKEQKGVKIAEIANQASVKNVANEACRQNPQIVNADVKKVKTTLDKVCKEAAENATSKPGFFGKIWGAIKKIPGAKFLGKHFGPLMMLGTTVWSIAQEVKNGGGLAGAGKELFKGLLGQAGYIAGTLLATAVFGFTGPIALLVAGLGGAIVAGFIGDKICGKSATTLKEEQETQFKQQQELAKQNPQPQYYGPGTHFAGNAPYNADSSLRAAEQVFRDTQNFFNNRYESLV